MINQNNEICKKPSIENCLVCSNYLVQYRQVEETFEHMREVISLIDIFISPSHTLKDFFIKQGVDKDKIKYLKYGFNTQKIKFNKKIFTKTSKIKFGFMGRVIPTKGIKVLVEAFKELPKETLFIYGNIGVQKRFLETKNIIFKGQYNNNNINEVLKNIDVLIVPSIWYENAPLVIQEAFLAGVIVITSDIGGMAELVKDKVNGFTFKAGSSEELKKLIKKISNNPTILNNLVSSKDMVVDIKDDVKEIVKIYKALL
jgi:glycosyltransferase involved in cell wall biosynthesis